MKASASETLMKCRKALDDTRTGAIEWLRDEPGGCPFTGQAVPGYAGGASLVCGSATGARKELT